MKSFNIPTFYRSSFISKVKDLRKQQDPRKKDLSPTILNFGPVVFYLARHFGFCYGVENAIEISYRAIEENPDKRIYLLSQMIHNPDVNEDLQSRGVKFLMDTAGNQIIPFETLSEEDIVVIPAFGTTLKIEEILSKQGIQPHKYDTTCPFVERVWKKAEKLGEDAYTIIIHGKFNHEETRATFSRSEQNSPSIIVKNIKEAEHLGKYILGQVDIGDFYEHFGNRISEGFDPEKDLQRVGVINQTTMLATETQEIANYFKEIMLQKHGEDNIKDRFADTRDTLCYATNENQEATYNVLKHNADLALVVGGYNSSNTSHIVELCEEKLPTYFISSEREIASKNKINHFNFHKQEHLSSEDFLPNKNPVKIILTSGASCPDAIVEGVLRRVLSFFDNTRSTEDVIEELATVTN